MLFIEAVSAADWQIAVETAFMEAERMTESKNEDKKVRTIGAEQFGNFIAAMRRERGLTQKQLAEQLYLSNKAVSKWERGLSMPDIALLEPLAETLGVTVTELLHGEKEEENPAECMNRDGITAEEVRSFVAAAGDSAAENREQYRKAKRKRMLLYAICLTITWVEVGLLYSLGEYVGITDEQISLDVLLIAILPQIFGLWFFFFIREKLPSYYDTEKLSYYSDGVFRMNMAGVYFNNKNWPYILKAGRAFCFAVPILWPAAYFAVRLLVPYEIWRLFGLFLELFVILGGLFIPIVVMGKKYEK